MSAIPNPFNPRTTIRFEVPRAGRVSLTLHDVRGTLVRTLLFDQEIGPGPQERIWDGLTDGGVPVTSGVYLARLRGSDWSQSLKLTLVR